MLEPFLCRKCGLAIEVSSETGVLRVITAADIPGVLDLFSGELDSVKCPACREPTGLQPTVAVIVAESPPAAAVTFGSAFPNQSVREATLMGLADTCGLPATEIDQYPNPVALRMDLLARFRPSADEAVQFVQAIRQGGNDWLARNWRLCTGTMIAGALVHSVAGVQVMTSQAQNLAARRAHRSIVGLLAWAESETWVRLWNAASAKNFSGSLEADLTEYVGEGVILREAATRFFEIADAAAKVKVGPSPEQGSQIELYVLEAIRASICSAARVPNPRAKRWAELYFSFEVAALPDRTNLAVSADRARRTIQYDDAWRALREIVTIEGLVAGTVPKSEVRRAAEKAGYASLPDDFAREGMLPGDFDYLSSCLAVLDQGALSDADDIESLLAVASRAAVRRCDAETAVRMADAAIRLYESGRGWGQDAGATPGTAEDGRAIAETWLGSVLNAIGEPDLFLERVGLRSSPWENAVDPRWRAALWLERLKALVPGYPDDLYDAYLAQAEALHRLLESTQDDAARRTFEVQHAVFVSVFESLDLAIFELQRLLERADIREKPEILRRLAETYLVLGRGGDALSATHKAMSIAVGRGEDLLSLLDSLRARALIAVGRPADARRWLGKATPPKVPEVAFNESSAWSRLIATDRTILADPVAVEQLATLKSQLHRLTSAKHTRVRERALFHEAVLHEAMQPGEAEERWRRVGDVPELGASVVVSAADTAYAYRRGDRRAGRRHLELLPMTIAAEFGHIAYLSTSFETLAFLRPLLGPIIDGLTPETALEDLRLIADIQREPIPRAQALLRSRDAASTEQSDDSWKFFQYESSGDATVPQELLERSLAAFDVETLSTQRIAQVAPPTHGLAILEWVEGSSTLRCLITHITASGDVSAEWVDPPLLDLESLNRRIHARLGGWHRGRPGDPFDLPDWSTLEGWLGKVLSQTVESGAHVVFVHHARFASLPWHVAARPYTASYIGSWGRLIGLTTRPRHRPKGSLGMLAVPRYREDARANGAITNSVERTEAYCREADLELISARAGEGDVSALVRVFQAAEVAKLLCHGFVDPEDGEVALMLASGGVLPVASSVAFATAAGSRHRLRWQQLENLSNAPAVVFSAACGTGTSHARGLGERLGLFGAMARSGMGSLVAPQWDIVAEDVLPVLDSAMERYLSEDVSLAAAVRDASLAAEAELPLWLAWSLAMEGDWR